MSYEKRGSYNHVGLGKQLLLFDGLDFDENITPMDVDALIEYHNIKYAMVEVKMRNVKVPYGERVALERMVRDFRKAGKDALAIVADHTVFDKNENIMVKDCIVREIYHSKEQIWRPTKRIMTVENLLGSFFYS